METDHKQTRIADLLVRAFERDEIGAFPFARTIPSGVVGRSVSAYQQLSAPEKLAVKQALANTRSAWFGFSPDPAAQALANTFVTKAFGVTPAIPPQRSRMPSASDLKRLGALSMAQLLQSTPRRTDEPGEEEYCGDLAGERVAVRLRYGSRRVQMEYSVHIESLRTLSPARQAGLNYEGLLGIGIGAWDGITLANADQSFGTLKEAILRCVGIVGQIRAIITQQAD